MAKLLDKITVVDIEATCWNGNAPEGMVSDIIEIGICLLDVNTGEISDNRGIIVKPERSTVSDFCTELTTITPELVDREGISYKEACAILRKEYQTQSRAWASFGAYDLKQFQRQCGDLGIGYPCRECLHPQVKLLQLAKLLRIQIRLKYVYINI
ncbi:MAG: exonuclease domain-containing protein, partial [Flavobacteriia bacterium]|nr:exonuclease domain-containing protein [Flavobacteriia bacterium]